MMSTSSNRQTGNKMVTFWPNLKAKKPSDLFT
jgi:hypothetical protein